MTLELARDLKQSVLMEYLFAIRARLQKEQEIKRGETTVDVNVSRNNFREFIQDALDKKGGKFKGKEVDYTLKTKYSLDENGKQISPEVVYANKLTTITFKDGQSFTCPNLEQDEARLLIRYMDNLNNLLQVKATIDQASLEVVIIDHKVSSENTESDQLMITKPQKLHIIKPFDHSTKMIKQVAEILGIVPDYQSNFTNIADYQNTETNYAEASRFWLGKVLPLLDLIIGDIPYIKKILNKFEPKPLETIRGQEYQKQLFPKKDLIGLRGYLIKLVYRTPRQPKFKFVNIEIDGTINLGESAPISLRNIGVDQISIMDQNLTWYNNYLLVYKTLKTNPDICMFNRGQNLDFARLSKININPYVSDILEPYKYMAFWMKLRKEIIKFKNTNMKDMVSLCQGLDLEIEEHTMNTSLYNYINQSTEYSLFDMKMITELELMIEKILMSISKYFIPEGLSEEILRSEMGE